MGKGGGTKGYVPEEHPFSPPPLCWGDSAYLWNAPRLHPWMWHFGEGCYCALGAWSVSAPPATAR